jgi:hypothetical protein
MFSAETPKEPITSSKEYDRCVWGRLRPTASIIFFFGLGGLLLCATVVSEVKFSSKGVYFNIHETSKEISAYDPY